MPRASGRRQGYRGRSKKRDANESEIIQKLESYPGVEVVQLDKPCDLIVGFEGRNHMLEVKNPEGKNTLGDEQVEFIDAWPGAPIHIVRNADEALIAIGIVSSRLAIIPAVAQR